MITNHKILFVLALTLAAFTASVGHPPDRKPGSVSGPQKVERPPLVSYLSAEKSTWSSAEEESFLLSESSGTSGMNPILRVALGFLVPGLPQYLDGHWRSYGYFALEGVSIGSLIVLNSQGNSRLERYLKLTRLARSNYIYPGLRNNPTEITDHSLPGYGEYYEDLTKWPSSGDYDDDPSLEGLQPEIDPGTFNGHQWEIAKINNYSGTNGGLPVAENPQEEINALEAYQQKVYPSEYNWDWTGLELENQRFHDLFARRENAMRRRSTFTAVLLANHLISGLDVLIQERLNRNRALRAARLRVRLQINPVRVPGSLGFQPRMSLSHRF